MASNSDEGGWNDDCGFEILRAELKTKAMVTALRGETIAVARVSRVARHGVLLPRALNSIERCARHELQNRNAADLQSRANAAERRGPPAS